MAFRIPFAQSFWQEYLSGQEANLPRLPEVQQVTERVMRILGGNPGRMQLQGTNTYLVGTGKFRILIDTGQVVHLYLPAMNTSNAEQGEASWIEALKEQLESNGLEISHVLLTHWHGDHTGGVPDLISYNLELSSRVYKNTPDLGQQAIHDGQKFQVEGATIRAVFTPGHAFDHMCFLLEEENALFTGDNVLGHGYSVVEDLGTYMTSLSRMADLNCAVGYPAHGTRIEDLPAKMKEYIQHKESRMRQVLTALERSRAKMAATGGGRRAGALTFPELINSMYGGIPDEVEQALTPFLSQVLWKLAEDRKVGFEGEPSQRRWFAVGQPAAAAVRL
ncbi:metallo-beta-lactamase domain protein [Aspergillus eucalypticola CBS 122712]|uniref:Metallo-beta-lactamase domain protein n=1 Tax=Aspergillus eucalypticola (strain CBS 122712 / IBT 29274) TaxID=1448314 RepID=A0A317WC94_ASPEC|nr:metallo-beta-lactamase domain protein [Aspergillus eucalypticola CBS 122712]PWY82658.1 metallo-beta-lactamase domain protein [Aspergillus eucalypticola CBS 122712]